MKKLASASAKFGEGNEKHKLKCDTIDLSTVIGTCPTCSTIP